MGGLVSISPDLTLVGVDLPTADALAIAESAVDAVEDALPGFVARDGSPEVQLLEVSASAGADVRADLVALPGRVVEGILGLLGVEHQTGTPALGTVTVALDSARTMTVPAGTQLGDPVSGIVVETTTDTAISAATSIVLPVQAVEPGSAANELLSGTALDVYDAIPGSVSATVTTTLSGGADPETDQQFFARGSATFARLTSSLVLPEHFEAYALGRGIYRAKLIDLYQPGGTVGSDIGHWTLYVYGPTAALTTPVKDLLLAELMDRSAAMMTGHIADAEIVTQPIALTVHKQADAVSATVQAAVQAALTDWMSVKRWPWGEDIRPTDITVIAAAVPGVDYVTTVATPASTVALADHQLAVAGTITVTVT
jgi:uncharacterized phage protein gp47/JayE